MATRSYFRKIPKKEGIFHQEKKKCVNCGKMFVVPRGKTVFGHVYCTPCREEEVRNEPEPSLL